MIKSNDDVILKVDSQNVQELIEVLCEIPMKVEQGEYSDGEPHRPSCVDSLIDQLIKYTEESNDDGEFCESCQTYHHDDEPCPPGAY